MGALRVIGGAEVRALMPMSECIELMRVTLTAVSAGEAVIPLRSVIQPPGSPGRFGIMPGGVSGAGFGAKLLSLFPGNPAQGLSSHLGVIVLFEPEHGLPVALINAAEVTAIRTAAVSGLATRLLAKPEAGDLAILGAGEQGASHLAAMACVRPLRRVRLWSRTPEHARAFAEREAVHSPVPIEVAGSVEEAVMGADLICTCTASREPILNGAWVAAGAHVNAVGASQAGAAEVDRGLLLRSRFVVDFRPSAEAEAGEYLMAKAAGALDASHIVAELGEIAGGNKPGRTGADEVTLFKSLGIAAEDVAVARFLLDRAQAAGVGQLVEL